MKGFFDDSPVAFPFEYGTFAVGDGDGCAVLVDARKRAVEILPGDGRSSRSYSRLSFPDCWFEAGGYLVFFVALDDVTEIRCLPCGARDLARMLRCPPSFHGYMVEEL